MLGRVLLRREGALAWVTLDHAGKFNAMTRAMWRQLREIFDALRSDAQLRCVVIRGGTSTERVVPVLVAVFVTPEITLVAVTV